MASLRRKMQKIVTTGAVALIGLGALSACQTTNYKTETVVDISETHIVLPQSLLDLDGFKIEEAKIYSRGSLVSESVSFTRGTFYFQRYYHGGFISMNKDRLLESIQDHFKGYKVIKSPQMTNGKIGDVYYATVFNLDKNLTCVVGQGNQGASIPLRRGMGYVGRTIGQYCEFGKIPNLDERVLKWMKKIRLRP